MLQPSAGCEVQWSQLPAAGPALAGIIAYAFVQPGDPVLDQDDNLYHRALKKLVTFCASLETLHTKIWGKSQDWIVDPTAPAKN
jgi:hypothetical protein